jgi:hypothetical protein
MTTQFLKPRSVDLPAQGAFVYRPIIRVFDEASPQDLEDAMNAKLAQIEVDETKYVVIESVEYQVYQTPPPMPSVKYSALVWATEVEIV